MQHTANAIRNSADGSLRWIRRGIWIYLCLLIIEGALRKWVVPAQLNGFVAIIRDPVAIAIYWLAYRSRNLSSPSLMPITLIGILMALLAVVQVALGVATIPVVMFGLRSYVLHLPLIFVIARVLTFEDVAKIGRFLMMCSLPMAILVIAQFRAAPSDRLNAGAGEGSGQIEGALGHIRPAGTFSYGTGVSEFFPIVEAFVIAGFIETKNRFKKLVFLASCSTLLVIPFSMSRTLMFWSFLVAATAFSVAGRRLKPLLHLTGILIVLGLSGIAFSKFGFVDDALNSFRARWDAAKGDQFDQDGEDILVDRLVSPLFEALDEWQKTPLAGQGLGLGSNFASSVNTGTRGFLLAESEVIRLIQEAGPIVGLIFITYRIFLCAQMVYFANRVASRSALPFLLTAATVPNILFSGMEQPTNLGFMIFGAGLAFAAASHAHNRTRGLNRKQPQMNTRVAVHYGIV